jgi:hypothetical protein
MYALWTTNEGFTRHMQEQSGLYDPDDAFYAVL